MTGGRRGGGSSVWDGRFEEASRTIGDTEAANRYLSVRNFRIVQAAVLGLLGAPRGTRILDVGCGTGHFAGPLAAANTVVGVDLSAGMLRFARAKGIGPVLASGAALPFETGAFDTVLATSVIQLVPDGAGFVAELVRTARSGGRIVITTINARNAAISVLRAVERKKYRGFHLYSFRELRALAEAAGADARRAVSVFYPLGRTQSAPGGRGPGVLAARLASTLIVEAVKR